MASATLTVTVNGGIPPLSIQVGLLKNGTPVEHFGQASSFTHLFDDLEANNNYDVTIAGFNPAGGNTSLSISGTGITLTPISDTTPSEQDGKGYFVDFNFNS